MQTAIFKVNAEWGVESAGGEVYVAPPVTSSTGYLAFLTHQMH